MCVRPMQASLVNCRSFFQMACVIGPNLELGKPKKS